MPTQKGMDKFMRVLACVGGLLYLMNLISYVLYWRKKPGIPDVILLLFMNVFFIIEPKTKNHSIRGIAIGFLLAAAVSTIQHVLGFNLLLNLAAIYIGFLIVNILVFGYLAFAREPLGPEPPDQTVAEC